MHVEHDPSQVVGKIIEQGMDEKGNLVVMGTLDCSNTEGEKACEKVAAHLLRDVSLQHHFKLSEGSGGGSVVKTPTEVSLCAKGKRPSTNILLFVGKDEFGKMEKSGELDDIAKCFPGGMDTLREGLVSCSGEASDVEVVVFPPIHFQSE